MRPRRRLQSIFGGTLALLVPVLLATVVLSPVRPVASQAMWSMGSDEVRLCYLFINYIIQAY